MGTERNSQSDLDLRTSALHAKYITRQEAADLLRVSPITVDIYHYRGLIDKYKVKDSNRALFLRTELIGFIEGDEVTPARVSTSPAHSEYLSIPEAAAFMRLTVRTMRTWLREKRIKGYNPAGGRVLIKLADLEAVVVKLPRPPLNAYKTNRRKWRPGDVVPEQGNVAATSVKVRHTPRAEMLRAALARYDQDTGRRSV